MLWGCVGVCTRGVEGVMGFVVYSSESCDYGIYEVVIFYVF